MNTELRPRVGVAVMIFKDGKVLMSKRKGSHGAGEYAFPGGHLEHLESFEECAVRETREECGIEIKNIRFQCVTNTKAYAPKHYVHIALVADWASGTPEVREPHKSEEWVWVDPNNHSVEPLFQLCKVSFDSYKTGRVYYPQESDL